MKTLFVSSLTTLAAATALLNAPIASADASCKPSLVQKDTSFPLGAQLRGQEGTVYMNVTIDENGRAQRADLNRSSGYASWIAPPRAARSRTGCSTSPAASARTCR